MGPGPPGNIGFSGVAPGGKGADSFCAPIRILIGNFNLWSVVHDLGKPAFRGVPDPISKEENGWKEITQRPFVRSSRTSSNLD